jgi:hypothetical protein
LVIKEFFEKIKFDFFHLAPYIIIRDSNNRKIEKRPLIDVSQSNWITPKRRSLLMKSSFDEQEKRNYLLAEFESVLTQISKEQFF